MSFSYSTWPILKKNHTHPPTNKKKQKNMQSYLPTHHSRTHPHCHTQDTQSQDWIQKESNTAVCAYLFFFTLCQRLKTSHHHTELAKTGSHWHTIEDIIQLTINISQRTHKHQHKMTKKYKHNNHLMCQHEFKAAPSKANVSAVNSVIWSAHFTLHSINIITLTFIE